MCIRENICSVGCTSFWEISFCPTLHLHFQALKAAVFNWLAGRTVPELFATVTVPSLVPLNFQIYHGCILLAFVLSFNLDSVSVI